MLKRRFGMRGAMVAAIIITASLVLGGVAFAVASMIPGSVFWGTILGIDGADDEGITAVVNAHPFGTNFREFVDNAEWESRDEIEPDLMLMLANSDNPNFSTFNEVATFFDVQFPSNSILDRFQIEKLGDIAIRSRILYHPENDVARVNLNYSYLLMPWLVDEVPLTSQLSLMFIVRFDVDDNFTEPLEFTHGFAEDFDFIEHYTSPVNGINAVIHYVEEFSSYWAVFSINDIVFQISLQGNIYEPEDKSLYFDTLKLIIDAFE
jgi:hypothetical protein